LQSKLAAPAEIVTAIQDLVTPEHLTDTHVAWVTSLAAMLKKDWREEYLERERKRMGVDAERLRLEVVAMKAAGNETEAERLELLRNRCVKSQSLINLYDDVAKNIQDSLTHVETHKKAQTEATDKLRTAMGKYQETMSASNKVSEERRSQLQQELQQSTAGLRDSIKSQEEERADIDQQIEDLESRKRELKMEVEKISGELFSLREKQRQQMAYSYYFCNYFLCSEI